MTTETYMVTTMFRGQLHLSEMRIFQDIKKAWDHHDGIPVIDNFKGVWRLHENRPPEKVIR